MNLFYQPLQLNKPMMPIETFLEARARQSKEHARMIRKYINDPDTFKGWKGSKTYTAHDAIDAELDAEKCEQALMYLRRKFPKPKLIRKNP